MDFEEWMAHGTLEMRSNIEDIKSKMAEEKRDLDRKLKHIKKKIDKMFPEESCESDDDDEGEDPEDDATKAYEGHHPIASNVDMRRSVLLSGKDKTKNIGDFDELEEESKAHGEEFLKAIRLAWAGEAVNFKFLYDGSYSDSDSDDDDDDDKGEEDDNVMPSKYSGTEVDKSMIIQLIRKYDYNVNDYVTTDLRRDYKKIWEVPYNWQNKCHVIVYEEADGWRMVMKGDVDEVLSRCTKMRVGNDEEVLDDEKRSSVKNSVIKVMNKKDPDSFNSIVQLPMAHAYKIIPKNEYPEGFPAPSDSTPMLRDLCYLGSMFFELQFSFNKGLLRSKDERFVFITGNTPFIASEIERSTLKMSEDWFRIGRETHKQAHKRLQASFPRLSLASVKKSPTNIIVDCSNMDQFTLDDLQEMLLGTNQLILANASPLLKVSMVTACIANGVPPIVSSHLILAGYPSADTKAAVAQCKKVGIKTFLLTSAEGEEARSQALEVGIFTKRSKTPEDIAKRLNMSVEEIYPRTTKSRIVKKEEMAKMRQNELMRLFKTHSEIIFSGLSGGQKYGLTYADNKTNTIYLFVVC